MAEPQRPFHDPADSLEQATDWAAHPQYLGDPKVVWKLIWDFVMHVANAGDTAEKNMAAINRLEHIFAGDDPAYGPVPHWTHEGGLLAHLQQTLKVPDQELHAALHTTFLLLLQALYKALEGHYRGQTDQAKTHLRVLAEEFTGALLGMASQRPHLYQGSPPGKSDEDDEEPEA